MNANMDSSRYNIYDGIKTIFICLLKLVIISLILKNLSLYAGVKSLVNCEESIISLNLDNIIRYLNLIKDLLSYNTAFGFGFKMIIN